MRVITGKYKGRTLVAPKNSARPTLDRMKETLFNIIQPVLQNAVVLDLFAGSGQLAIEALSRGASEAILCDNSKEALQAINVNFAKIGLKPHLVFGDYHNCLFRLDKKIDVVFVDPPYKSEYYLDVLNIISDREILTETGMVICEHAADDSLPKKIGVLNCFDGRKIGTVKFSFYKRNY